jgi:arylsulfatase A-like enzyme
MKRTLAVGLWVAGVAGLASCEARPVPTSLLLVTIDTLRADRVGAWGDRHARTPVLDRLAREGTRFERAYTPAPITLPAHATILTGMLPPAHGVRGNGAWALPPTGPRTLAEVAAERGLATAAFVGAFPVASRFGLARGFGHYDDDFGKAPGVHYEFAERRADAVVAAALDWLAGRRGPVFVWVHLFDPHAPYDPPPAFAGEDPYRGEIAAADAALGRLLEAWDRRAGASVVAVTSDHGEAFGEHGEESHSLFLYDTTLHVPLALRGAGVAAGRSLATPVGLEDLAATLLARLGPGPTLPGRDLLAGPLAPRGLYAETLAPQHDFGWSPLHAWRAGGLKYVRAPRPELYDVVADPGERRDLAASRPADVLRLEAALAAVRLESGDRDERGSVDASAAERLRALGYVQGPGGSGSGADPKDMKEVARRIARGAGPFRSHAEAAATYAEIAALDPDNPLVNLRLGSALLKAGRPAEALAPLRRVTRGRPRSAEPWVGLATACAALGRLDEAATALDEALRLEPHNAQAHFNRGELARAAGDRASARRHYEAALADPVTAESARRRLAESP